MTSATTTTAADTTFESRNGSAQAGTALGFEELLARADEIAEQLRADGAQRDRDNLAPIAEIDLLRQADLLQVQEPVAVGGSGLNFAQAQQITRRIARGDTSVAQLLGYHYAQTRIVHLYGTAEQAEAESRRNVAERLFWGGVQNDRGGTGLVLTDDPDGDGYRLTGTRTFASGAGIADWLSVTASYDGELVFLSIPGGKDGFRSRGDWDNIGQRLTDSSGVIFEDVHIERSEILGPDPIGTGGDDTPFQSLVTPHWQLSFVDFYVGTAEGAIADALEWTRENASAWESSGVESAADDPYILRTVGEVVSDVRAAALIADHAGARLQEAIDIGPALTWEQRAEAAVAVYEAKIVATRSALEATSRLFEIQGARATTTAYAFDRYWRNIRTHTLHDPISYKAREVGDYALNGRAPEFSMYR